MFRLSNKGSYTGSSWESFEVVLTKTQKTTNAASTYQLFGSGDQRHPLVEVCWLLSTSGQLVVDCLNSWVHRHVRGPCHQPAHVSGG